MRLAWDDALLENPKTMRYRPFGRTGLRVSALSFGCMRLYDNPELNARLLSRAVELGVNYFETTRYYLGGTCQHRTAGGLRGKTGGIIISGKEGVRPETTACGFRREIERQLDILGISHFKFFQVGWFSWGMMPHLLKRGGALEAIRKAQDEGLIRHVGFTGHDTPENFIRCIETGLFDSITVPYNLVNRTYEPLIKRAGELGIGVVAMCPVAGGVLSTGAEIIKKELGLDMPTPAVALRFVLSNPWVSTACSGMNTLEQLEENVVTVFNFDPERADEERRRMQAVLEKLDSRLGGRICTGCRYCMPCPQGIDIPRHMELYRMWKAFGLEEHVRNSLKGIDPKVGASACRECGRCEKACPNRLEITKSLKALRRLSS